MPINKIQIFEAEIEIIGVNPYVLLPKQVLTRIFEAAKKNKGAIQVYCKINGKVFLQNLVKYGGKWRLYLNTPIRKITNTGVGDKVKVEIKYDPTPRLIPIHVKLKQALDENAGAKKVFDALSPSRQKEIIRYIGALKSEETVDKNVKRAIAFLLGKTNFVGRIKP